MNVTCEEQIPANVFCILGRERKKGKMSQTKKEKYGVVLCGPPILKCKVFTAIFCLHSRATSFIDFILSALLVNLANELDFNNASAPTTEQSRSTSVHFHSHHGQHIELRNFARVDSQRREKCIQNI